MAQAHAWDQPYGYGPPCTIKDPLYLQFLYGMIYINCPFRFLTLSSRRSCPSPLIGEMPQPSPASESFFIISIPIRCKPHHFLISWFLENPELGWTPPQTLVDWMAKARADGKPIVYIGFGSITVPNPKLVTERIIRGVLKSKRRSLP